MTTFKHTPGPHFVDPKYPGDVESSKGTLAVATLYGIGMHSEPNNPQMAKITLNEAIANAKLFARAATLAELLLEVKATLHGRDDGTDWDIDLIEKIDDALEGL